MSDGAIAGVRVLDAGGPITAYCSRILADLGADVVVVEPEGGDPLRRVPIPGLTGEDGKRELLFGYYHAGQRALRLDAAAGPAQLEALGREADVVLISPSPHRPLHGWDPVQRRLAWANEHAVVCALTPFGLTGPLRGWRATPMTSFAMGGEMSRSGPPEGPPVTMPDRQQWDEAATHAALCVLAALLAVPIAGGQLIDLSVHELASMRDFHLERYAALGHSLLGRTGVIGYPPTGTYECSDGPIDVGAHQVRHWDAFLAMLDHPDELSEPSLADPLVRRDLFDGLLEVIQKLVKDRERADLVERGQRAGLPCAFSYTPTEFIEDAQVKARGILEPTPVRRGETVPMPSPGFRSEPALTVPRTARGPAPALAEPAPSWRAPERAATAAGPVPSRLRARAGAGPLAGIRVITFGVFVAGNTAGGLLAELGADVVKIEGTRHPEVLRMPAYALGPTVKEPSGHTQTVMNATLNRSIRNVSIELDSAEGRELMLRLVRSTDVMIENFGTGVLERWGCGYDRLLQENERLVLTSLSGYGRTGPRASWLAYGTNISHFIGLTAAWGYTHGTHTDYVTGQHAAMATVAALHQVARAGRGVHIDAAQIGAMAAIMPVTLLAAVHGHDPSASPNEVVGALHSGVYRCVGHDAWVAVELENRDDWVAACKLLQLPPPDESEDAPPAGARAALDRAFEAWAATWTNHTAAHLLQAAGLAAGAVQSAEDLWRDPQLRDRGFVVELDHPDLGTFSYPGNPYRGFTGTPPPPTRRAPRLGEHTRQVLEEWTDLDAAAVNAAIEAGHAFQG